MRNSAKTSGFTQRKSLSPSTGVWGPTWPGLPWPHLLLIFPSILSASDTHSSFLFFKPPALALAPAISSPFLLLFKFYVWISPCQWGFPWPPKLMLLFPAPILPGTSKPLHLLYFYFIACISSKKYNLSSFHPNPEDVKLHEVRGLFYSLILQCWAFTGCSKGLDIEQ